MRVEEDTKRKPRQEIKLWAPAVSGFAIQLWSMFKVNILCFKGNLEGKDSNKSVNLQFNS
jgi:hypothetical protein